MTLESVMFGIVMSAALVTVTFVAYALIYEAIHRWPPPQPPKPRNP